MRFLLGSAPDEGQRQSQAGLARRLYVVCPERCRMFAFASVGEGLDDSWWNESRRPREGGLTDSCGGRGRPKEWRLAADLSVGWTLKFNDE